MEKRSNRHNKDRKGTGQAAGANSKIRGLREISISLPEAIVMQVGKKTRYGSKPHPTESFGYTKELLEKRDEMDKFDAVLSFFADLQIQDEITASKWLVLNQSE